MKSRVVAVIEGHELYLRTRNGRFDLHWVDPFGGTTKSTSARTNRGAAAGHRGGGCWLKWARRWRRRGYLTLK